MTVLPGFEAAADAFRAFAQQDPTYSGQLAVRHRGELVVDLVAGDALHADSLVPVFSSSKGAIGVVVALLVEREQLDLDAEVASYWPEFAAAGKSRVTVRQLLSHAAGLNGVDGDFTDEELLAHAPLAERLAAQRPLWRPGAGFAYHAFTIGTLADELVRRTTGRTLAEVFRDDVARPRGIDVHLGVPVELDERVVTVELPAEEAFAAYLAQAPFPEPESLRGMSSPRGPRHLLSRVNDEDHRRAGPPAVGGLASARGLAAMYAALHHDLGAGRVVGDDALAQVGQVQVAGLDLGSDQPHRFGVVFQKPSPPRLLFGSAQAFGHDGAGGSLGLSDPAHDLAVGYVSKRIHLPVDAALGPDPRMELLRTLRRCASGT